MPEQKVPFMLSIPISMKIALEDKAKEAGIPTASFGRKTLAEAIGYTLPTSDRGRARRYATPEARVAAQKARAAELRVTVNAVLKAIREGKLNLADYLDSAGVKAESVESPEATQETVV